MMDKVDLVDKVVDKADKEVDKMEETGGESG